MLSQPTQTLRLNDAISLGILDFSPPGARFGPRTWAYNHTIHMDPSLRAPTTVVQYPGSMHRDKKHFHVTKDHCDGPRT